MKILLLTDFLANTGFSNVAAGLVTRLNQIGHTADIVGINYNGDPHNWPNNIYPALDTRLIVNDRYGRARACHLLAEGTYDLFIVQNDVGLVAGDFAEAVKKLQRQKHFKTLFYFPVDAPLRPEWGKSLALFDQLVTYTEYGKAEVAKITKKKAEVIPPGLDTSLFFPLTAEEKAEARRSMFPGLKKDTFIVLNVNRNQIRKGIPETMEAFKWFHDQHPESFLYLHMLNEDAGWNLADLARQFGLVQGRDWNTAPEGFGYGTGLGFPAEVMNWLYNVADVLLTTSTGEGWGLSTVEAMAAGTPVVCPTHTAFGEVATGRALTFHSFISTSYGTQDGSLLRPLSYVPAVTNALTEVYEMRYPEDFRQQAYQFAQSLSWSLVGDRWQKLLHQIEKR